MSLRLSLKDLMFFIDEQLPNLVDLMANGRLRTTVDYETNSMHYAYAREELLQAWEDSYD